MSGQIICYIRSSQGAKKRAMSDAIKSKFKACRCGLQARMHCSRVRLRKRRQKSNAVFEFVAAADSLAPEVT